MGENITALILAGGHSKRFGSPKALATLNNKTFIEIIYNALTSTTGEVYVNTREEIKENIINILNINKENIVLDEKDLPCRGPLRGIISFFRYTNKNRVLIVAVDYPFINTDIIKKLLYFSNHYDIVAMTPILYKGYPLLTLGVIKNQLKIFEKVCYLKGGNARLSDIYRISPTLILPWRLLTRQPSALVNVNTRADLLSPSVEKNNLYNKNKLIYYKHEYYLSYLKYLSNRDFRSAIEYLHREMEIYKNNNILLFLKHVKKDIEILEKSLRSEDKI